MTDETRKRRGVLVYYSPFDGYGCVSRHTKAEVLADPLGWADSCREDRASFRVIPLPVWERYRTGDNATIREIESALRFFPRWRFHD